MKTKFYLFALLFSSLACASSSSQNQNATDTTAVADTTVYPANLEADSFPDGEPVHETGVLKSVEDSGYPFFTLEIEFPDLKTTETFSLNITEIEGLDTKKLNLAKGKKIDFTFIVNVTNSLLDLREKNNTIFHENEVLLTPETKKITGTLSGADQTTEGDLPGKVKITAQDGKSVDFEYFITPEMVKYNNKTLTAFYEERAQNIIRELQVQK